MYLYQIKDNDLEVYKIKASRRLKEYKEEQMKKIPLEGRIMDVKTNDFSRNRDNLENAKDVINYYRFVYNHYDSDFGTSDYSQINRINIYSSSREIETCKKVIKDYISQKNSCGKVLEVQNSKEPSINFLLLTEPYYEHCFNDSYMRNIICLPKSLYLLELFLQERFELLEDEDIREILELFDVEGLVKKINYEDIKELKKYNLIRKKELKKMERKTENSEKVLRLLNTQQ